MVIFAEMFGDRERLRLCDCVLSRWLFLRFLVADTYPATQRGAHQWRRSRNEEREWWWIVDVNTRKSGGGGGEKLITGELWFAASFLMAIFNRNDTFTHTLRITRGIYKLLVKDIGVWRTSSAIHPTTQPITWSSRSEKGKVSVTQSNCSRFMCAC